MTVNLKFRLHVPESATMSLVERPCAANLEMRFWRLEVGGGMLLLAKVLLAVLESLLPSFTVQFGPPSCTSEHWYKSRAQSQATGLNSGEVALTMTTESLAAMAKISAQDTTPGHTFSTAVLILSMTLNPRADRLLGIACCSPVKLAVSDKSIDPSHP